MPSHRPFTNIGCIQQSCELSMFVGQSAVFGDLTYAMRSFEELVERYESNASQLDDSSLISLEASITRALCLVIFYKPSMARKVLAPWLRTIGLSPANIHHLEQSGITDLNILLTKSEKELKGIADRGQFSSDMKTKLLRSASSVQMYLKALKAAKERGGEVTSFTDYQLSWSACSPLCSKRGATWRGISSESASPPSPRFIVTPVDEEGTSERDSPTDPIRDSLGSISAASASHSRSPSGSGGSLAVSVSSFGVGGAAHRSHTLSPPSPIGCGSTQSTPTLGANSRVVQSTSMQFGVQRSPKPSRLVHAIPHKWTKTTKFRLNSDSVCHFCQRPLGFGFLHAWEKCRSCKWKVHTHCRSRIGDSCGLTPEHLRILFDKLVQQNNGDIWNDPQSAVPMSRSLNEPAFQYPDSGMGIGDSSSSTNSSAPSTPALPLSLGYANSPYALSTAPSRSGERKFTFPDAVPEVPDIVLPDMNDGDNRGSGWPGSSSDFGEGPSSLNAKHGEGSEGTVIVDSIGSAGTDTALSDGSTGARSPGGSQGGHTWDRNRWNMSTIRGPNAQASWNEVNIPFQKIDFEKNSLIGHGRFGNVLRGYHFGDVAVKFLNMNHIEESKRLDEFKSEVTAHKNTRHDNIVLFLGYCIESDKFGIVMSLCKGRPLHSILHETNDPIDLGTALVIATQICQGVSYLHTKKILHKDLRSKNIFIESKNKVVITDFGLFSMKRLRHPSRNYTMIVPAHWLSYLAPELIRALSEDWRELPFSESTDVFAFSTIWFELLTSSFPFDGEFSARIIWMVGNGIKTPLYNLNTVTEVKDLLLRCWSFSSSNRPSFGDILTTLNTLPRKRLDRSPPFPAIRSYESIF
nr:Protein kinase C and Tyrosine protein kinase domain containing protein [Haemonchus contortus]